MGCAISRSQHRIIDSNAFRSGGSTSIELISSSLQLIHYFQQTDTQMPKCIFIFGGSGSNKGEFIYEMICSSWLNYKKEQLFLQQQRRVSTEEARKRRCLELDSDGDSPVEAHLDEARKNSLSKNEVDDEHLDVPSIHRVYQNNHKHQDDSSSRSSRCWSGNESTFSRQSLSTLNFVYSYIDVERLIIQHLRQRIKQLNDVGIVDNVFDSATDLLNTIRKSETRLNQSATSLNENHFPNQLQQEHNGLPFSKNMTTSDQTPKEQTDAGQSSRPVTGGIMKRRHRPATTINERRNQFRSSVVGTVSKDLQDEPDWMKFLRVCEEDFERYHSQQMADQLQTSSLREHLVNYANCVTNNWVFGLIQREIEQRNKQLLAAYDKKLAESQATHSHQQQPHHHHHQHGRRNYENRHKNLPEMIYIVNLVPNQINVFRHCLFLKQMPNLNTFCVNFIAVHLIRSDFRKKDLDLIVNHSLYDEINLAYINHFRQLNRLVDIRIEQFNQKVRIRLVKSKSAIKIRTEQDLKVLLGPLEATVELDLSQFPQHFTQNVSLANNIKTDHKNKKAKEESKGSQKKSDGQSSSSEKAVATTSDCREEVEDRGNLLFLVDDKIDIGDLVLCVEDRSLDMAVIRNFVQSYLRLKESSLT